jgi:hypothetical protein
MRYLEDSVSPSADRLVYRIVYHDPKTGEASPAGSWTMDAHAIVIDASAEPRFQSLLANAAGDANSMTGVDVEVAPPADAEMFEIFSRNVGRDDAEFLDALRGHLRTYYNIELIPA